MDECKPLAPGSSKFSGGAQFRGKDVTNTARAYTSPLFGST